MKIKIIPATIEKITIRINIGIDTINGLDCSKCKEHFPFAESNQKDGSLICYECRTFR